MNQKQKIESLIDYISDKFIILKNHLKFGTIK